MISMLMSSYITVLANSLDYPERIQRGIEWTQFLKRLFFTCGQIFLFSLFQPSLFIQYSTEECSTVQVLIWCLNTIALHDITGQLQYNYNTIQYNTIQYNCIVLYCIVVVLELAG